MQSRSSYGHVIVDEAQDLSPMQCRGQLLYIAVTRAVSRLDLVHARELPPRIS